MRRYCGAFLEQPPPFTAQLTSFEFKYGTPNLFCQWQAINTNSSGFNLITNLTRYVFDQTDEFGIEIVYSNGVDLIKDIQTTSFYDSEQFIDHIYFYYFTIKAKNSLPFLLTFSNQSIIVSNYLGIYIAVGVVVFLCFVCSIFFYKCSRILIDRQNLRLRERQFREAQQNEAMIRSN